MRLRLGLLIGLYLLLATAYSVVVPLGRGADEWAHYWYARFIAEQGRLPHTPAERERAGYKSDWPPLYHLLAAALTAPIDTNGPPQFKYRADNFRRQMVRPAQRSEAILHTEDERFPWRQEILVWHMGRFLSLLFSAATLLVTYALARDLFGPARSAALLTVALLAFTPRFLFTGMLFNYDSLMLLLASLFLWQLLRIVMISGTTITSGWNYALLGLLAGLAVLTKYLAILLPLEIILLILLTAPTMRLMARRLLSAFIPFGLLLLPWFTYLIYYFNEVTRYGLLLGTLAPLLRGDGSDRTVERLFAWLSGGTAPPPAPVDPTSHSAWEVITALPLTFWGIPLQQPYPLNWFVMLMSLLTLLAAWGLWQQRRHAPRLMGLLLLHAALPIPLMLARLVGARNVLEAVQGRHILFLSGPACALLLIWGWRHFARFRQRAGQMALLALLLSAALSQLLFMQQFYPPPLPVQTTPYQTALPLTPPPQPLTLEGGATLQGYTISPVKTDHSLRITFYWRGGPTYAPADYRNEVTLLDEAGMVRRQWRGYQTEARYPTRVWEATDFVRDETRLPLTGLPAGNYQLQWRLGDFTTWGPPLDLGAWTIPTAIPPTESPHLVTTMAQPQPTLTERASLQLLTTPPQNTLLRGPHGQQYEPLTAGSEWANFIVAPQWPAGPYHLADNPAAGPLFFVAESQRNFNMPPPQNQLLANFGNLIELLGYDLPQRTIADPAAGVPLTLYWRGLQWMADDFVIFVRLLDNQQNVWGERDRRPRENYSTLFWAPAEIVADGFGLPLEPTTPPGIYTVHVGWYQEVAGQAESLPLLDPQTALPLESDSVVLGPLKIGGPPPGSTINQPQPETIINQPLGDEINLLGVDVTQTACPPCELTVRFYWQALRPPTADYTVFLHMRDEATGAVVAQRDRPPVAGAYPTSLWEAGEIIPDKLTISLLDLPPGQYQLLAGLYDFTTGARLSVANSANNIIKLHSFERTAHD